MQPQIVVRGEVAPGYEACRDAFERGFREGAELGAACAVHSGGRLVVDLWGGMARANPAVPWKRETVVPVFSVTKGIAALCVLKLVADGALGLDRPVAAYWPEFGAHGKDRVTVREALAHRAGVPALDGRTTLEDLQDPAAMSARLAAQKPVFPPASSHAYHAFTIGWITSELVRRTTGRSLGTWLRDEIARPLGVNLRIGGALPDSRLVASVECPPQYDTPAPEPDTIAAQTFSLGRLIKPTASGVAAALNRAAFQRVELAGANALADAASLATLYALACAAGATPAQLPRVLLDEACTVVSEGVMWGTGLPGPAWGAGLMLPFGYQPMLGPGSFGHDGMGGSLAFGHRPSGLGFAYVRNRLGQPAVVDTQVYRMVRAVAECAGLPPPLLS